MIARRCHLIQISASYGPLGDKLMATALCRDIGNRFIRRWCRAGRARILGKSV
jgi:hypothetical protein